jgi:hypothetical protein
MVCQAPCLPALGERVLLTWVVLLKRRDHMQALPSPKGDVEKPRCMLSRIPATHAVSARSKRRMRERQP